MSTKASKFQTIESHYLTALQQAYATQAKKDRKAAARERALFKQTIPSQKEEEE